MIPIAALSLDQNPNHSQWLRFKQHGKIELLCGKVEIGQGISTALIQIAADALGVGVDSIALCPVDTQQSPNEGYTAGSVSIEQGGGAIRLVSLSARQLFIEEAGRRLAVEPKHLDIVEGKIVHDAKPTPFDYWDLASDVDLDSPVSKEGTWKSPSPQSLLGTNVPRIDLISKVTGAAFVHDIAFEGMLHGRVVRPPSLAARLKFFDAAEIDRRFPDAKVYRNGTFLAVVAPVEFDAVRAAESLASGAQWDESAILPHIDRWADYLMAQPSMDETTEQGQRRPSRPNSRNLSATYSRPPIAHASMGPSCAVAQFQDGYLQIFTASQNVFSLRRAIAQALGLDEHVVRVVHHESAGCYGHNGSDDSAMDAALLALHFAPQPVRLQWSRADELGWSPFGTPMAVRVDAEVDSAGQIMHWNTQIWTGTSAKRPGFLPHIVDLLAATHMEPPIPLSSARENPIAFIGSDRNADPPYEIPYLQITRHKLPDLPLRCSSLRTLGGFLNVFAIECFMDELAAQAGIDPVAFRLRHLHELRGEKFWRRWRRWRRGTPTRRAMERRWA